MGSGGTGLTPFTRRRRAGPSELGLLLTRAAAGDHEAFADLYDASAPRLYGLAHLVLDDAARAEEATHDAFLEVWRTAGSFDPGRVSAIAWLLDVVHRRALAGLPAGETTGSATP